MGLGWMAVGLAAVIDVSILLTDPKQDAYEGIAEPPLWGCSPFSECAKKFFPTCGQADFHSLRNACSLVICVVLPVLAAFLAFRALHLFALRRGDDSADRVVRAVAAIFAGAAVVFVHGAVLVASAVPEFPFGAAAVPSLAVAACLAIGAPAVAAFRAHERLTRRASLLVQARAEAGDVRLLALTNDRTLAGGHLPVIGPGERPSHILVRVRPPEEASAYRQAPVVQEELAIVCEEIRLRDGRPA
jgi:hypothetical protein